MKVDESGCKWLMLMLWPQVKWSGAVWVVALVTNSTWVHLFNANGSSSCNSSSSCNCREGRQSQTDQSIKVSKKPLLRFRKSAHGQSTPGTGWPILPTCFPSYPVGAPPQALPQSDQPSTWAKQVEKSSVWMIPVKVGFCLKISFRWIRRLTDGVVYEHTGAPTFQRLASHCPGY